MGLKGSSWKVTIAEVAFKVIFAIGQFILYRKTREGAKQNLVDNLGGASVELVQAAF